MTLDDLDPNASPRGWHRTARKSHEKRYSNGSSELFAPEKMNNKFDWRSDLFHNKQSDDNEEREGGESLPEPTRPAPDGADLLENGNVASGRTDPHNVHTEDGADAIQLNGKAVGPEVEADAADVPTWRRRFSLIPGTFGGQESSGRWKEWKHALKFGRTRKMSTSTAKPPQKRVALNASDEAARMRASNLVTSLIAGSPAALFLASSLLQDDHGTRRAPILLSQLAVNIEDVSKSNSRHTKYRLNLEYGIGPNRLKWSVIKDMRDFISLHSRFKGAMFQSKNIRGLKKADLPHFPKASSKHNDDDDHEPATFNQTYLSIPKPGSAQRSMLSVVSGDSAASSGFLSRIHQLASGGSNEDFRVSEIHSEMYRNKVESYLKQLVLVLALKPEANRLFQFFELSPLGVLLSYENGFQGKQGYVIVSSRSKAQGWRVGHLRLSDITQMVARHTNKWFLVRSSYLMYVSDIYSTTPLEVFLVDSSFKVTYSGEDNSSAPLQFDNDNESFYDDVISLDGNATVDGKRKSFPHFVIKFENSERELKIIAKSRNQAIMWVQSVQTMLKNTTWAKPNRFGSFAPVRQNSFAQWFVDGRDHFWAVSSALEMAKDVIYIHDWWLSPELYMRRPANGNQEWRLDRILKRKAEQGVKIFVIVYRNVGSTVVTDSSWTKHSLIDLHVNIHVLRSPNQWLQNTYFWAHHEKLCIVDHTVAFVGGIDLCFGRFDTPDHVLVDDSPLDFGANKETEESIQFQTFPGKDYSNPRVKDFYDLDKPYESMYDRDVVPRMPWHDVHMMIAGQPARDLARHFVQRWNYLLRQKRPSRPTPILTPPSEFTPEELDDFDLSGTCEVQLLRSSGNWSLGLKKHEQSIQNAYLKLIETSEHFVYFENQFFITSTCVDGTVVENRIGDALVDRIIRAHTERKRWKAVIVIPLMPGFESQVDEADGSAVRVIMQCQFQSISRGTTSIFAKLKKMNINPYDYIQFYSLRKWGRIGPDRTLVSEQLYIHAKILIVDDRSALIGSANINERSQRGNRDSEIACVVRDTEMVNTTMDGQEYKASKFAHTLRMRLMREHLGIDVDILEIVEKRFNKIEELAKETETGQNSKTFNFANKDHEVRSSMVELASRDILNMPSGTEKWKKYQKANNVPISPSGKSDPKYEEINREDNRENLPTHLQAKAHKPVKLTFHSFNNRAREENAGIRDKKQFSSDSRVHNNEEHKKDVEGGGHDKMGSKDYKSSKLNAARSLQKWAIESMMNESTHVFLPNVEQVLEFLTDEGFTNDGSDLSNDDELCLAERDQERWNMLKRISYLQRVAAKQQANQQEEKAKLAKAKPAKAKHSSTPDGVASETKTEISGGSAKPSQTDDANGGVPDIMSPSVTPGLNEIDNLPGENIPVVCLDSEATRRVVETINEVTGHKEFPKFIDPYGFSDPLEDSFYEDVWFANAHRNTIIFREVFHCQPDDTVDSWVDYKNFSKLHTAFVLGQKQAARSRPSSSSSSNENSSRHGSVHMEDVNRVSTAEGILGEVPDDPETTPQQESSTYQDVPQRGKSGQYGLRNRSPFGSARVYSHQTADRILSEIQGHLVLFPTDWLWKELESGNWFYNMDRLPPIEIYD